MWPPWRSLRAGSAREARRRGRAAENQERKQGMKVISVRESVELCTESGWSAYDMILDEKMDKETIKKLGALGDLTYLGMLKQPFYRIEQPYYMIKGLEGADRLRTAMLAGHEEILERVRETIEG